MKRLLAALGRAPWRCLLYLSCVAVVCWLTAGLACRHLSGNAMPAPRFPGLPGPGYRLVLWTDTEPGQGERVAGLWACRVRMPDGTRQALFCFCVGSGPRKRCWGVLRDGRGRLRPVRPGDRAVAAQPF